MLGSITKEVRYGVERFDDIWETGANYMRTYGSVRETVTMREDNTALGIGRIDFYRRS